MDFVQIYFKKLNTFIIYMCVLTAPHLTEQFVNPNALVSENTVLKVLDDSDFLKRKAQLNKIR